MIFNAVPYAVASYYKVVVLGGASTHLNIRVANYGLLSRRKLSVLFVVKIANAARQRQIAINSTIFNSSSRIFDPNKFVFIFWFMIFTQRVGTSLPRRQHTSTISCIGTEDFSLRNEDNTTGAANFVWDFGKLFGRSISPAKFCIARISLLFLDLLRDLNN